MKPKLKRSTVIPACLVVYLGVMAYIGRGELAAGNYLYYFGIICATLACIVMLHFSLKKRERLRREREEDMKKGADADKGDSERKGKE